MCLLCFCARLFIVALWSPAGKGLASWLSFVMSVCEFVAFLGQVWYLIVSIPDLCHTSYIHIFNHFQHGFVPLRPETCWPILGKYFMVYSCVSF